jgi:hypothetical protein
MLLELDHWSLFFSNVQLPSIPCRFPRISSSNQSILYFHCSMMKLVHLLHQDIVLLFLLMRSHQQQWSLWGPIFKNVKKKRKLYDGSKKFQNVWIMHLPLELNLWSMKRVSCTKLDVKFAHLLKEKKNF